MLITAPGLAAFYGYFSIFFKMKVCRGISDEYTQHIPNIIMSAAMRVSPRDSRTSSK